MTTKSFNQAFLRAFSKDGQPGERPSIPTAVPSPERVTALDVPAPGEDDAEIVRVDGPRGCEREQCPENLTDHFCDLASDAETDQAANAPAPPEGSIPSPHFPPPAKHPPADRPLREKVGVVEEVTTCDSVTGDDPGAPCNEATANVEASTPESVEFELETRATGIISDLDHHARLLETMPLLVIPTTTDDEYGWLPSTEFPPPHMSELELVRDVDDQLETEEKVVAERDEDTCLETCDANATTPKSSDAEPLVGVHEELVEGKSVHEHSPLWESEDAPAAGMKPQPSDTGDECPPGDVGELPDRLSAIELDGGSAGFESAWEVDHVGWTSVCRQLYESEAHPFAQAGQQLFTATAEGLRVLAITSAYRGEGRTTLALLLARSAAEAGVRVAVMDADLDNPQLALNARLQPVSDWRRALDDEVPLEEAAIHAVEERMTLFPLEPQSRGEPLRLSDPRVTKLIHGIASRFDLLIIDMGPIANDDRRLFAGGKVCPLDAAVVVRDLRHTTDDQAMSVVQRLSDLGVEAVGIAENFVREPLEMSA
jgi:Mrp family chromosome partitioning ATPase